MPSDAAAAMMNRTTAPAQRPLKSGVLTTGPGPPFPVATSLSSVSGCVGPGLMGSSLSSLNTDATEKALLRRRKFWEAPTLQLAARRKLECKRRGIVGSLGADGSVGAL